MKTGLVMKPAEQLIAESKEPRGQDKARGKQDKAEKAAPSIEEVLASREQAHRARKEKARGKVLRSERRIETEDEADASLLGDDDQSDAAPAPSLGIGHYTRKLTTTRDVVFHKAPRKIALFTYVNHEQIVEADTSSSWDRYVLD